MESDSIPLQSYYLKKQTSFYLHKKQNYTVQKLDSEQR